MGVEIIDKDISNQDTNNRQTILKYMKIFCVQNSTTNCVTKMLSDHAFDNC